VSRGGYVRCPQCGASNRSGELACFQCQGELAAPTSRACQAAHGVALEMQYLQDAWRWRFHVGVLILAGWLSYPYFTRPAHFGLLDYAILPFHEAGHLVLMPFAPRFLVAAGGTLAQLGLPLGFAVYFFWKRREPFSACVALLWLFASMQNMGIYMKDARFLLLPLFGADPLEGHDWNYLFGQMRLLHRSVEIGGFFQGLGRLGMAGVLAGMLGLVVRGRPQPPPGA
jgi:hypothetical protein